MKVNPTVEQSPSGSFYLHSYPTELAEEDSLEFWNVLPHQDSAELHPAHL